jgi:hypothetical protein
MEFKEREKIQRVLVKWLVHQQYSVTATSLDTPKQTICMVFDAGNVWQQSASPVRQGGSRARKTTYITIKKAGHQKSLLAQESLDGGCRKEIEDIWVILRDNFWHKWSKLHCDIEVVDSEELHSPRVVWFLNDSSLITRAWPDTHGRLFRDVWSIKTINQPNKDWAQLGGWRAWKSARDTAAA